LSLALACGTGAALAFIAWVGNGSAAGALIGVPGAEHQVAIAQLRARTWFFGGIALQVASAGAIFTLMNKEDNYVEISLWAALLSVAGTLVCGVVVFLVLKAFR
jgi:hypothetical protein